MRDDIISIIRGQKDLSHVFITTFNIDFVFIESVLLRELRKCGHPTLTILADADEISASFASQGRWVSRIGRRYRVVPIRMEPGFRFHPKAVLLSGPKHCELMIGSGNLTFGGMRQNEEFWLRFDSRNDEHPPIAAFRSFANQCLNRAQRAAAARGELEEAFDPSTHEWASGLGEPGGLLGRVASGDSLLDQMQREIGALDVQRIVIASPYFDDAGQAVSLIAERWPSAEIEVLIQEGQSHLLDDAWGRIREPKALTRIVSAREDDRSPFIHAKFYGFIGSAEAVVLAGSANCSRAALTIPGTQGNAELLAVARLGVGEFNDAVLSGITKDSEPPVLRDAPPERSPQMEVMPVRILAATFSYGDLAIEFDAVPSIAVDDLLIDGQSVGLADADIAGHSIRIRWSGHAHRVSLGFSDGGDRFISREHWIDHEFLLSATSRQRQMAQALGDHVSPGQWSFQGWTEVMRLLGDNLRYTPTRADASEPNTEKLSKDSESVAASEFFSDDYRLPGQSHDFGPLDESARVLGLRGLLLEYFGIDAEGADSEDETPEDEHGEEDSVDRPEDANQGRKKNERQKQPKKKRDLSESEQRRGRRIAKQIVETLTSTAFVDSRPPAMLGSDLAIASVLLVSGHAEGWLADGDFVDLTYRMWSFLFFDDESDTQANEPAAGAIERRFASVGHPSEFASSMRSARLAASLATWCFSCPTGLARAETERFRLASRLAVARLPWIWCLDDLAAVEKELFAIAERTGWLGDVSGERRESISQAWNSMLEEGVALARLETILQAHDLADLRGALDAGQIPAGSLLWQGPKLGFCVLSRDADRRKTGASAVPVLSLRSTKRDLNLMPAFLLPFHELLAFAAESAPNELTPRAVATLVGFASTIVTEIPGSRRH